MNLQNILHEIEKVDTDVVDRLNSMSRRHMFSSLMKKAVVAGSAAAPVAMASLLNKTYGQSSTVADVLNFALTLEYLEAEYYNVALAMPGFLNGEARTTFMQIAKHENAHVALLKGALGGAAVAKPKFDLTYGGAYPDTFTNYKTFLTQAYAFEDTGVRAYKGQAPALMSAPDVLTIALQIHSVEALHAAKVRYLIGLKGWITGSPAGLTYAEEDKVSQGGVNLVALTGYNADRVSESFDEPLTKDQVLAIVKPYFA